MTPFELDILLHYYARSNDHQVVRANPPIWPETCQWFFKERLLDHAPSGEGSAAYAITEKGRFYIEHLTKIPLPVETFIIPQRNDDAR